MNKHNLEEFEEITNEILKTRPSSIKDITEETINAIEANIFTKEDIDIEDDREL